VSPTWRQRCSRSTELGRYCDRQSQKLTSGSVLRTFELFDDLEGLAMIKAILRRLARGPGLLWGNQIGGQLRAGWRFHDDRDRPQALTLSKTQRPPTMISDGACNIDRNKQAMESPVTL
jgi:hypothetical protein